MLEASLFLVANVTSLRTIIPQGRPYNCITDFSVLEQQQLDKLETTGYNPQGWIWLIKQVIACWF